MRNAELVLDTRKVVLLLDVCIEDVKLKAQSVCLSVCVWMDGLFWSGLQWDGEGRWMCKVVVVDLDGLWSVAWVPTQRRKKVFVLNGCLRWCTGFTVECL